jgi:hypothetical protein
LGGFFLVGFFWVGFLLPTLAGGRRGRPHRLHRGENTPGQGGQPVLPECCGQLSLGLPGLPAARHPASGTRAALWVIIQEISVGDPDPDPDPHVFGPPGFLSFLIKVLSGLNNASKIKF